MLSQENIFPHPKRSSFAVEDPICSAVECASAFHGDTRDRSQTGDKKNKHFCRARAAPASPSSLGRKRNSTPRT